MHMDKIEAPAGLGEPATNVAGIRLWHLPIAPAARVAALAAN
jgi:hypothetical protein